MTFGAPTPNDGWQSHYIEALAALGHETYFVPAFSDSAEANGNNFYNAFPSINGAFNWNCWPEVSYTNQTINTTIDKTYLSNRPTDQSKTYMMGLSPVQFKHLSPTENWYRAGSTNLLDRIEQVLNLSPDFLEIITWNDNGESHYFGNIWEDSMPTSYSSGYNHSGWQALIPSLISAYKNGSKSISNLVPTNGEAIQGAFWHTTLTSTGTCASDPLGKPLGYEAISDTLTVGIYASSSAESQNLTLKAYSGGNLVRTEPVVQGLNKFLFEMQLGKQYVEVVDEGGRVLFSGEGPLDVVGESGLCNFNFQVVEIGVGDVGAVVAMKREEGEGREKKSGHGHAHVNKHRAVHLHAL